MGGADIKDILMGMGGDWVDNLPALEKAVNSMDQGVGCEGVRGHGEGNVGLMS